MGQKKRPYRDPCEWSERENEASHSTASCAQGLMHRSTRRNTQRDIPTSKQSMNQFHHTNGDRNNHRQTIKQSSHQAISHTTSKHTHTHQTSKPNKQNKTNRQTNNHTKTTQHTTRPLQAPQTKPNKTKQTKQTKQNKTKTTQTIPQTEPRRSSFLSEAAFCASRRSSRDKR